MNQSDSLAYIAETINRYHSRASRYRIIFLTLRSSQICCAASIPLVSLMAPATVQPVVNGVLGALIVVIEGLQGAFEFQRYWLRYRSGGLALGREQCLFNGKAGPYKAVSDPDVLFVERSDAIIAETQSGWIALTERITGGRQEDKKAS
jgi:hypothetical protein